MEVGGQAELLSSVFQPLPSYGRGQVETTADWCSDVGMEGDGGHVDRLVVSVFPGQELALSAVVCYWWPSCSD